MTDEQRHSAERQQDDSRWQWAIGILVTILLFLLAQAAIALVWGGRITQAVEAAQGDIAQQAATLAAAEERLRLVENARGSTESEVVALRRDLTDFRAEQRDRDAEQRAALQAINDYLARIYRNGSGNQ